MDLNTIYLHITAQSGSGDLLSNLFGNLLCAVSRPPDGNSPVGGLSALLNRLLTSLRPWTLPSSA